MEKLFSGPGLPPVMLTWWSGPMNNLHVYNNKFPLSSFLSSPPILSSSSLPSSILSLSFFNFLHPCVLQISSNLTTFSLLRRRTLAASVELTISPSTTRVGWIGTAVMGRSMCGHLLKAGYLTDSSRVVASQSAVVFSIVGYPSDVCSVVLDPTTGALSGLCPGSVLVDLTTKNCSSIDAPITGGGDLNIPIYPGPLFQLPPNLSRSCLWRK